MNPRVDIYSEPNFEGKQTTFQSEGKRTLKESFTQNELIGRTFYIIHPIKVNGKEYALDNSGANKQQAYFHLWEWSKDNMNQIFTMLNNGVIKCVGNNYVLDVQSGNFSNGARLWCWPQNNTDAQLWTYDSNTKLVKLKNRPFCLNIHNYTLNNGALLNIWELNGHESQMWDIRLCEIKNGFAARETFVVNYGTPMNLLKQRETFNTCMANLYQHTNAGGESSGWVGIGDYNWDPYVTPKGSGVKGTNNNPNQGPRYGPYSSQFSPIGDFKPWVGKKFYIRCRQNRNFVLDTRSFQANGRGDDQGFIGIWTFDPNQVNQIWTIDAFGHLGPANNRRYILGGGPSANQGDWPRMADNGNGAYNGHRWKLQQGSICHQNDAGVPFLHVAGAVMANGTRVGYWRDTRARAQGNCTWELEECGWMDNGSNGNILNDDVSSIILKPFTDIIIYEHGFNGQVRHFHNGQETDWLVNLTDGDVAFNDTMSSYKVRAGAMDGKRYKDRNDVSGNSICTIRYSAHIPGAGWTGWVEAGQKCGQQGNVFDAIHFEYSGPGQMYARAHVGNIGWMNWVTSGVDCGVVDGNRGNQRLIQALEFKIDGVNNVFFGLDVLASGQGWLGRVGLNKVGGTTGQSRPLEQFALTTSLQAIPATSNFGRSINLVEIPKNWVITDLSIGKFEGLIGKPFVLRIRNDSINRIIDTEGHQNGGGFIKLYDKVADFHPNQTWTVDKDGHLISWQNRNSILWIDNTRNGAQPTIIGWKGNEAKANDSKSKWRLTNEGYIESIAHPNQVLDAAGKKFDNNTRICLWCKYNMNNQKFDAIEIRDMSIGKFDQFVGKSFILKSRGNASFVLDTENHQNGGGNIKIYTKAQDMHQNQTWTVDKDGHLISWQNRNSILWAENTNNSTQPIFIGWKGNEAKANDPRSKWRLNNDGQIENIASPNQILDISGGSYRNANVVILWGKHGGNNQKWDIAEVRDLDIGNFKNWINKPFALRNQGNGAFVLDTNVKQNGGGPITIWNSGGDWHANQTWTVDDKGHLIPWSNKANMVFIDNTNVNTQPKIVSIASQADNVLSKWRLTPAGQVVSLADPSKCLDMSKYVNGQFIIIYGVHGGGSQKWTPVAPNTAVTFPATKDNKLVGRKFYLVHNTRGADGKMYALDMTGNAKDGVEVYLFQWMKGNGNQLFTMNERGGIVCANGGRVLDAKGGSLVNGTRLVQWPFHGGPNQTFGYDARLKNVYIYSKKDMCLHAGASEYKDRGVVCLYACGDCPGSKFHIVFEDGTSYTQDFKPLTEIKNDIGQLQQWVGKTIVIKSQSCQNIVVDSRSSQDGKGGHKGGSKIGTYTLNQDFKGTQNWTIDTYGRIVLTDANKQWCIYAPSMNNSTPITLAQISKLDKWDMKQYWTFDGRIITNIADRNKAFDMDSRMSCKPDGEIHIYQKHGNANQQWVIADAPVDIGEFIKLIGKAFYIKSRGDAKFVVDTNGKQHGGGPIRLFSKDEDWFANQTWTCDAEGHLISWDNRDSILYVETTANGVKPSFISMKGNDAKAKSINSKWKLNKDGQVESVAAPNQILDVEGGKFVDNTNIILWTKNGGNNQKWDHAEPAPIPSVDTSIGEFSKWIGKSFILTPASNDKIAIDTEGHHTKATEWVKLGNREDDMHPNQTWTVDKDGMLANWTNRDAVLYATKILDGKEVNLTSAKDKTNDNRCRWRMTADGIIESIFHSGFALEAAGTANSHVVLSAKNAAKATQKWKIIEVRPCPYKTAPTIGSVIVGQCTDFIVYGVDTNCKEKPKKITIHNGMRYLPGRSTKNINYRIEDFLKKYGINGVKEVEVKFAVNDSKQTDTVEEYTPVESFTAGTFWDEHKVAIIIICLIILALALAGLGYYLYRKRSQSKTSSDNPPQPPDSTTSLTSSSPKPQVDISSSSSLADEDTTFGPASE